MGFIFKWNSLFAFMDLREQILKEHSKSQTLKIVKWIGGDQARFNQLLKIFLHDEPMVVQRAAWPMSNCVIAHPVFIRKHLKAILDNLDRPGIHDAVRRNTIRILEEIEIPKAFEGRVMDLCFRYVSDPKEKAAVKASSLTILQNLAKIYPEILPELKTMIEEQWDREGPAFRARARRILKKIR